MTIPNIGIPVANGGRYLGVSGRGRGSGRTTQWEFPDPMQMFSTAVPATANQIRNRLNNTTLASSVGGYGGGGVNLSSQSGASPSASPVVIFAGNNAGLGQLWRPSTNGQGPQAWMMFDKSKAGVPAGMNDYAVTWLTCTCAYIGVTGTNTLDSGLQATIGGGRVIADAATGFAFLRTTANLIQLGVRPTVAAGLTLYPLTTPASFDETKQHTYGLLLVSANATQDAYVIAYVDYVPIKVLQYGAGKTNVTVPGPDAVNLAFTPCIYYGLNGGLHVKCPAGVQMISAPTVTDAMF